MRTSIGTQKASLALLVGLTVTMFLVSVLLHVHRSTATFLLKENGPFEVIGFLACMAAAALFIKSALLLRSHDRAKAIWLCALAMGFFFIGMEEISWGQSFFRWSTPPSLSNLQGETNLHNMSFVHYYAHYIGITLLGIYFVIIPLVYYGIPLISPYLDRISLPIVDLSISSVFAACFIFFHILFSVNYRNSVGEPINYGEMQEFIYQICAMLFAYECSRKSYFRSRLQ